MTYVKGHHKHLLHWNHTTPISHMENEGNVSFSQHSLFAKHRCTKECCENKATGVYKAIGDSGIKVAVMQNLFTLNQWKHSAASSAHPHTAHRAVQAQHEPVPTCSSALRSESTAPEKLHFPHLTEAETRLI